MSVITDYSISINNLFKMECCVVYKKNTNNSSQNYQNNVFTEKVSNQLNR